MQSYQYPVYIKKDQNETPQEAIFPIFPNSRKPLHIDLTDHLAKRIVKDAGLNEYLSQLLLSAFEELDEAKADITKPKTLDYYQPPEYSLYLMSGYESFEFKKLPKHSIAVVGDEQKRIVHIKENDDQETMIDLTLSAEESDALQPPAVNAYKSIEKNLENCFIINKVKEKILSAAQIRYFSCHDEFKSINVSFRSKRQCQFCATYLPPIMRLTFVIEITAGTILTIGSLQQSQGALIPMDKTTAMVLSIVQSVLSTLLTLPLVLSGPGARYMGEFGGKIDAFVSKCCSRRAAPPRDEKAEEELEEIPTPPKWYEGWSFKKVLAKGVFALLLINFLWTDANYDYIQFQSLMEMINRQGNSFLPHWLVTISAWIMFVANQANDPMFMFSFITMLNDLMEKYLIPTTVIDPALEEIGRGQPKEEIPEIKIDPPEEKESKSPHDEEGKEPNVVSDTATAPLLQIQSASSGLSLFSLFTRGRQKVRENMTKIGQRFEFK